MASDQNDLFKLQNEPSNADLYHRLLSTSWTWLCIAVILIFALTNLLFALLYFLCGEGAISGASTFLKLFFFSVQTFSTIGYGTMAPATTMAHTLVAIEAASGMIGTAIVTGMVFAKFSKPTARVTYSNKAVVMPYDGSPTFCVRLANGRNSEVVDATLKLSVLLFYTSEEGERMRRFTDLPLVSDSSPAFVYTWTAMHHIDESSPLARFDSTQEMEEEGVRFFVSLVGIDAVSGQPLYSRAVYEPKAIYFNHRFKDVIERRDRNQVHVAMERFHEIEAL